MADTILADVKALTFDVFGTVVNWRLTVTETLKKSAATKIQAKAFSGLSNELQARAKSLTADDWARFAQEWRNSYGKFTQTFEPGVTPWKDIDTHHRDSLLELLDTWELNDLYTSQEVEELSKVWHYLQPWPDSSQGIHKLGSGVVTATLSNGNHSLLNDLNQHGNLGFRRIISAEDFRAYKPHPSVYLGACEALGYQPSQVAMVAAHLGDLAAARALGLRTIYIERPEEEGWQLEGEDYQAARDWVDLWLKEGEGGFVEAARRLGLTNHPEDGV